MDEFLEQLYKIIKTEAAEEATLFIFDFFDSQLTEKKYEILDKLLLDIDIHRLTTFNMRSLLVASGWAKNHLKNRKLFYELVEVQMNNLIGVERTRKLLRNLK